jgi:hypothetical protein
MTVEAPPPLVTSGRAPVLHGVLGAAFHLERLLPDDEDRIAAANALILEWIGESLRWTLNSRIGIEEPFDAADLEFASAYPSSLGVTPHGDSDIPDVFLLSLDLNARRRADMGLACHGGEKRLWASPYSYRFFAEVLGADDTPQLIAPAVLRVTVPATWPLDDFERRVAQIAALLRLRWGAAGLTYSAWETQQYKQAMEGMYAHARRYPGYDVGLYVAWMEEFHFELRTVSWLTFLGKPLAAGLTKSGKHLPRSDSQVLVFRAGDHIGLKAGAAPEAGDLNRLSIPRAYMRADELVRPIRARKGLNFYESWTEATTAEWLCRFEKRLF